MYPAHSFLKSSRLDSLVWGQLTTGTLHLNNLLDKNRFFHLFDFLHKYRLFHLLDDLYLFLYEHWHLFYHLAKLNIWSFAFGLFID